MAKIYSINGPVVTVKGSPFKMIEMVRIGEKKLLGEVIKIENNFTTIQVYEQTTGLKINEEVYGTDSPVYIELGPSLLNNIFDGIGRPLKKIEETNNSFFIQNGISMDTIDPNLSFKVNFLKKVDDYLKEGEIYAFIQETNAIKHYLMVPPGVNGKIININKDGDYKKDDVLGTLLSDSSSKIDLKMTQKWPIKIARPAKKRLHADIPLLSGQRIIDTFFPIPKGGAAAIPGGFGTGKTMMQHQFAKWCDADIICYIGCGERGNEMTQVLDEFSELIDPRTKMKLLERTILIANTSNMPVAAREASIYTGVTIAEYYRDMGYHVAIMADSTSRWAEALREISGRLEEMPAEEGFPAYLPSRISKFYERAGLFETLTGKTGSITIIGAVSPQGADFSEPVTQNTKRFVRAFWALDKALAYSRHYPAINWMTSYSEYLVDLSKWYETNVSTSFLAERKELVRIMAEEDKLLEIVKLIGEDVLPDEEKLIIEMGRLIRNGFLQQNSFHSEDTYVPIIKQEKMIGVILYLYQKSLKVLANGVALRYILSTNIFDSVSKMKYTIKNDNLEEFKTYYDLIDELLNPLSKRGGNL
ncbi:MAG: V-type ATP synthase subunit A [Acholeplasmatales bacterium]|jgi:V/A-type H+-transporting ATPase subunit A|nr:V-type ATP synthase subunit A [Acholeplasmatales bacterium]